MRFLVGVVSPDQAGQHAGIGRLRFAADQRQPHARFGPHGETAEDLDMRVAGAKQHDVGLDGAR